MDTQPKFKIGQCVEYESALEPGTWDDVIIQDIIPHKDTFKYCFNGEMSSGEAPESCFRKIVIGRER